MGGWLRIKPGLKLYKSKKKKNGAIWILENEILKSGKTIKIKHEFRSTLHDALKEVIHFSKHSNTPFQLKDLKQCSDDFERISLINVLYYHLKCVDKLEVAKDNNKSEKNNGQQINKRNYDDKREL